MIASKYFPKHQEPIEYNAVTLSSNAVTIKAVHNNDWKIALPKKWVINFISYNNIIII